MNQYERARALRQWQSCLTYAWSVDQRPDPLLPTLSPLSIQVAETFTLQVDDSTSALLELARLDTCCTVVDASMLMQNL
jgi:hypothetical protein